MKPEATHKKEREKNVIEKKPNRSGSPKITMTKRRAERKMAQRSKRDATESRWRPDTKTTTREKKGLVKRKEG